VLVPAHLVIRLLVVHLQLWKHRTLTDTDYGVEKPFFQDGVVLGADTRSTAGTTVADKNCEKIHHIADNIKCCGAGTAADTEAVTSESFALSVLCHSFLAPPP